MHIGFITPEYPHSKLGFSGGLGTSIKNLAENLVNADISVSVFVVGASKKESFEEDGIQFYFLRKRTFPGLTWLVARKGYQVEINNMVSEKKIDLLEAPDWTGITAFMRFKVPLLIRMHGSDAYFCELEGRQQKWKNRWFERNALKNATFLVSVSDFTAQNTRRIFSLKKEIKIIHNGVDTQKFKPNASVLQENTILYFGSIIRKKGILELARAFNILKKKEPKATLRLLGKDVADAITGRSTLSLFFELLDDEFKNDVQHLNEVDYAEIPSEIGKAKIVALPSFAEAFPMTWLEGMAMEKALVTSNIGWAKEIMVNGETGFTIDPKEHELFASQMLKLLKNDEVNHKFGVHARNRVLEEFSAEKITAKNIEFYKSVLKTGKS